MKLNKTHWLIELDIDMSVITAISRSSAINITITQLKTSLRLRLWAMGPFYWEELGLSPADTCPGPALGKLWECKSTICGTSAVCQTQWRVSRTAPRHAQWERKEGVSSLATSWTSGAITRCWMVYCWGRTVTNCVLSWLLGPGLLLIRRNWNYSHILCPV